MVRLGKHRTLGPGETMLGGLGGLSLLAVPTQNDSQPPSPSLSEEDRQRFLEEMTDQLRQEAKEQFGAPPAPMMATQLPGTLGLCEENFLLQLYFEGDRLGAPAEGMAPGALTYEDLMQRQYQYPEGTDESDVVKCFIRFTDSFQGEVNCQAFAASWALSITRHHRVATYGRTWKDLFATVKAFDARAEVSFYNLLKISRDRNSMGNGCLALVYPVCLYAQAVGADPVKLAQAATSVSHYHPVAQRGVVALATYFQTGEMGAFTPECFPPEGAEMTEHTPLVPGCLWAALECAREESKGDAIRRACAIGGDVDSFLSLGLLLWGRKNVEKF